MATTTTRPVSLQPSWYGIDFSRRSSGNSLALPSEPRSPRPSSSGSGQTRPSATMGFNLIKDKVPTMVRRSSPSRPRTPLPEITNRGSSDLIENVDDQSSPKRSHRFRPTTLRGIKKKRSISAFFSNGDVSSCAVSHDTPIVRPASTPPMENKRASVPPEADTEMQNKEGTDGFQRKTHFLTRDGMKHHPYPHDAPYMQAYDPVLLDNDRFTEVLLQRLNSNGSPTFHDYGLNPPANVLDLGCGHGGWAREAATAWRSFGTKVTGFDLVDVSSDVDEGLLDNITWVQGNFLKYQLPFVDNSFDLVRMANLSLAIPQSSWLPVLSEVRRVLAPGGRLELIDDQILFPYDESPTQMPRQHSRQHSRSRESASSFGSASHEDITGTNATSTLVDEPIHLQHTLPPEVTAAEWATHAENSKGLETVFENMLLKRYGIHHRPQDIIDVVLSHVFGHKHANQIKSMHLALAPTGCAELDEMMDGISTICQEVDPTNGQSDDRSIDLEETWLEGTGDDQSKPIRPQRPSSHQLNFGPRNISPKAADILGIGSESKHHIQLPERNSARTLGGRKLYASIKWKGKWREGARRRRASMESLQSEIPEAISPKAAERLGIAPANRRSWGSQRSSGSQSSGTLRADHSSGEWTCRDSVIPDTNSVKAADCVGISSSLSTTQSSGLILWPSTFIPVEPLELEMHACKHMHVLLGCKAALSDFIQDVKGPDGQAHISQDELNDLTWEYECFRRKRFKWPEKLPCSRLSITSNPTIVDPIAVPSRASSGRPSTGSGTDAAVSQQSRSGSLRPRSSPEYGVHARASSEPSYGREDLTFVRILRVYEAYKPGNPEDV